MLVHLRVLADFLDYNDFLDRVDALIEELNLEGELQVASFHPQYRFADSEADDPVNCTNAHRTRPCTCCAKRASAKPSRLIPTRISSSSGISTRWVSSDWRGSAS